MTLPRRQFLALAGAAAAWPFAPDPREIVDRLHQEVQKVLQAPGMDKRLAQNGIDPMPIAPQAFDALVNKEVAENIALVKAAGIKVN